MTSRDRARTAARFYALRALGALLVLALALLAATGAQAKPNPKYGAIVIDASTGAVLYESGADKRLHPASLVKMMTLLMTFEALENGTLRLRDRVTVSRHAANMVPSKLGLDPGESIRVEDAIYAVVTKSANDIAVALAERVGGTESNFAAQMTRRAHAIGMKNTYFYNASGLHDRRQVSTPRDMARLGYYILHRYPQYYHYFSTRQFTYQGVTYRNHNRLMESYRGMDGFKTGFIQPSGFNLVASAKRGDRRLIGVVFGGRTTASRNAHMASILDRAFQQGPGGRPGVRTDIQIASAPIAPARAPLPGRKPDMAVQVAALAGTAPAAGAATNGNMANDEQAVRMAEMNAMLQGSLFQDMIGQGDSDPAVSKRLETGLIAIAALRHGNGKLEPIPVPVAAAPAAVPAAPPPAAETRGWSVQIGAYSSRAKTDRALQKAQRQLPSALAAAMPVIVPLRAPDGGWVFRGRLSGYSKAEAEAACRALKECLPVAPQTY